MVYSVLWRQYSNCPPAIIPSKSAVRNFFLEENLSFVSMIKVLYLSWVFWCFSTTHLCTDLFLLIFHMDLAYAIVCWSQLKLAHKSQLCIFLSNTTISEVAWIQVVIHLNSAGNLKSSMMTIFAAQQPRSTVNQG